jgi:hypothetical protein
MCELDPEFYTCIKLKYGLMKSIFGQVCNYNDQYLSIEKMKMFEELFFETNAKLNVLQTFHVEKISSQTHNMWSTVAPLDTGRGWQATDSSMKRKNGTINVGQL